MNPPSCAACGNEIDSRHFEPFMRVKTCMECGLTFHRGCNTDHVHATPTLYAKSSLQASVGKDAVLVAGAHGGIQSQHEFRIDMFPRALLHVGNVCYQGNLNHEEEGNTLLHTMNSITPNWHKIPPRDHFNRCMVHIQAYLAGDRSDDHLGHAVCRALFGLEVHLILKENNDGTRNTQEEFTNAS